MKGKYEKTIALRIVVPKRDAIRVLLAASIELAKAQKERKEKK